MSKEQAAGSGIGFFGLLAIVFITLKLLDRIDWPWLWVLAPLWAPALLIVALVLFVGVGFVAAHWVRNRKRW